MRDILKQKLIDQSRFRFGGDRPFLPAPGPIVKLPKPSIFDHRIRRGAAAGANEGDSPAEQEADRLPRANIALHSAEFVKGRHHLTSGEEAVFEN
jgi:hypothetical protein